VYEHDLQPEDIIFGLKIFINFSKKSYNDILTYITTIGNINVLLATNYCIIRYCKLIQPYNKDATDRAANFGAVEIPG
jgi:hypothetical protein